MFFSKQDYDYLFDTLSKKFVSYGFVDSNYIINLLDKLMNDGVFEGIDLRNTEISTDMNPQFYINFKIQNYLYYKICKSCEEDIDLLLALVEDKRRVVNLIFRKLKIDDSSKVEDYIMNAALLYNGVEAFDTFITRYVMATARGIPFEVERKVVDDKPKALDEDIGSKKKKKKKKNKTKVIPGDKLDEEIDISQKIIVNENQEHHDVPLEMVREEKIEENILSLYDIVVEKCKTISGTGIKDNFIQFVLMSDLFEVVESCEDEKYKLYFLMRFGLLNETYYNRSEIADIMECQLLDVIELERYTISYLKSYLNRTFINYEECILNR